MSSDKSQLSELSKFVLAGGTAALLNWASRFAFSTFLSFERAVVAAFFVGLTAGFFLMRGWVFPAANRGLGHQVTWYAFINLLALTQTLLISSYVALWFAQVVSVRTAEAMAHALGIAVPAGTSFVGHKFATFTTQRSRKD